MDHVQVANQATSAAIVSIADSQSGSDAFRLLRDKYAIDVKASAEAGKATRKWIEQLFESNMRRIYETSTIGWSISEVREELWHRDSRFIVVRGRGEGEGKLGFLMWRFDWEESSTDEDVEVAYCYELQLTPEAKGKGLGRHLMSVLADIAKSFSMRKVILTAQKANGDAIAFYRRIGFETDEIDPSNYEDVDPVDYVILSKSV